MTISVTWLAPTRFFAIAFALASLGVPVAADSSERCIPTAAPETAPGVCAMAGGSMSTYPDSYCTLDMDTSTHECVGVFGYGGGSSTLGSQGMAIVDNGEGRSSELYTYVTCSWSGDGDNQCNIGLPMHYAPHLDNVRAYHQTYTTAHASLTLIYCPDCPTYAASVTHFHQFSYTP